MVVVVLSGLICVAPTNEGGGSAPGFESQVDNNHLNFSLWPLSCFRRHVSTLIPRLSGLEDSATAPTSTTGLARSIRPVSNNVFSAEGECTLLYRTEACACVCVWGREGGWEGTSLATATPSSALFVVLFSYFTAEPTDIIDSAATISGFPQSNAVAPLWRSPNNKYPVSIRRFCEYYTIIIEKILNFRFLLDTR